jgi:hypothetical protein
MGRENFCENLVPLSIISEHHSHVLLRNVLLLRGIKPVLPLVLGIEIYKYVGLINKIVQALLEKI